MKRIILTILLILASAVRCEAAKIIDRPDGRVNFVFLSDGYQEHELVIYREKVDAAVERLFETYPFSEYQEYINVYREDVPSNESGADRPADGVFVDTVFGATYGYGGTDRCLFSVTHKVKPYVHALDYEADVLIVMVNDTGTGGCTSAGYTTISNQPLYIESMIHELGHQIGGLGDEGVRYEAKFTGEEPDKPNLTLESDPAKVKWRDLIEPGNGVGVFEGGLFYRYGIYRPMEKSLMGDLRAPLGPVNEFYLDQALKEMIGEVGDDTPLTCGGFPVTIMGTDGDDRIRGTFGRDVIHGGDGDDKIYGIFGEDVLCGGEGDDYLDGGFQSDWMIGGPGDDTFKESFGDDHCDGGPGRDTVKFGKECEFQMNMEN